MHSGQVLIDVSGQVLTSTQWSGTHRVSGQVLIVKWSGTDSASGIRY